MSYSYNTCLRQEAGFCCTEYTVCDSSTDTFQLGTATTAKVGSDCGMDYVYIEGKNCIKCLQHFEIQNWLW